jgi:hypothetical protein
MTSRICVNRSAPILAMLLNTNHRSVEAHHPRRVFLPMGVIRKPVHGYQDPGDFRVKGRVEQKRAGRRTFFWRFNSPTHCNSSSDAGDSSMKKQVFFFNTVLKSLLERDLTAFILTDIPAGLRKLIIYPDTPPCYNLNFLNK